MSTSTFLATQPNGLSRASLSGDGWRVEKLLPEHKILCIAADPRDPAHVLAGTSGAGLLGSADGGRTWRAAGLGGLIVKSLTFSPFQPGAVYAGTKPPALFASSDSGGTWRQIEPFQKIRAWWWRSPAEADLGAYIQAIALSPADPDIILAGIEAGAVVRSADGGRTWAGHRPGALRDCHSLIFHAADGRWAYEAGGTGAGAAVSGDSGQTWRQPAAGLDRHYGWAVAADPAQPEIWYMSASPMLSRCGLPVPAAHVDGQASAYIFRSAGGAPWQKLGGGLPDPLQYMAYALLTDRAAPGHLYAGLSNGDVWHSANHGTDWAQLPFNLGGIQRVMIRA